MFYSASYLATLVGVFLVNQCLDIAKRSIRRICMVLVGVKPTKTKNGTTFILTQMELLQERLFIFTSIHTCRDETKLSVGLKCTTVDPLQRKYS